MLCLLGPAPLSVSCLRILLTATTFTNVFTFKNTEVIGTDTKESGTNTEVIGTNTELFQIC